MLALVACSFVVVVGCCDASNLPSHTSGHQRRGERHLCYHQQMLSNNRL